MIPRRRIQIVKGEFYIALQEFLHRNNSLSLFIPKFEEEFAKYIGVEYAVCVGSGRQGMKAILKALKLCTDDEVIIPAYTLKDLIGVIESLGLKVVPADISLKTFNIDPETVARKITKRTKVILATHLFGVPCQINSILEIAKQKAIFVIEDCAHSVGSGFGGHKTGSFGDAAFFSFETIKLINAYGGGMITTNDKALAERIRRENTCSNIQERVIFKKIISAYLENLFLPACLSYPFLALLASETYNEKAYNMYRAFQGTTMSEYLHNEEQDKI